MVRTRTALFATACSILGGLALNGAITLVWSAGAALAAHRPRGWAALAVLLSGLTLGAFYGWQIGQALCLDADPAPPPQTPANPPGLEPSPQPRQGWVRRMATTRASLWRNKGKEQP